jgi:hypothetical protein
MLRLSFSIQLSGVLNIIMKTQACMDNRFEARFIWS